MMEQRRLTLKNRRVIFPNFRMKQIRRRRVMLTQKKSGSDSPHKAGSDSPGSNLIQRSYRLNVYPVGCTSDGGSKEKFVACAITNGNEEIEAGNEEITNGNEEIEAGNEEIEAESKIQNDRISQLPNPILQRILCYLSTKQAFQSSTLSKSWRYICLTSPKLELRESFFNGNRQAFFSFLETTLSRYRDQNISLQEFLLEISSNLDSEFANLLQTWIPVVLLGLKKFSLNFISDYWDFHLAAYYCDFHLAATVFKAESLEELHLTGCDLNHTNNDKVMLNHLRKLSLSRVRVSEVTLERIISSCPVIERLVINRCDGLGTIKVNNHALKLLKSLDFLAVRKYWTRGGIEIDLPNIECIRIRDCKHWHHSADYLSFSHLKSLHLSRVLLSENSFHRFSVGMCCLEELTLIDCCGFDEFKLTSRSIKTLSLCLPRLRKAAIDVPTIRCFELSCSSLPSISFTTPSLASEWKSKIIVQLYYFVKRKYGGPSSILIDIYQLHKAALCHSEFSLHIISPFGLVTKRVVGSPVAVENLTMDANISAFPVGAWLGHLFRFFRPRNIHHFFHANPENDYQGLDNLLVNSLREFLLEGNQPGLEQVLVEEEEEEAGKQKIWFRLKWRGESVQASLARVII